MLMDVNDKGASGGLKKEAKKSSVKQTLSHAEDEGYT